ncbi:hypothetical protein ACFC1R_35340 [Kitasatospora sp. NPDC056138]|uniref:hypothetical protein n=1 Tax=Kitasatospora sp. NPDC056138 TaxID=3345724 RepID=UPI0035DEC5CC
MLCPCWTCRGSIGGKAGSPLELDEKAGLDRLECPRCMQARAAKDLGPLVLPAPTKREQLAALVSAPDDPLWEVRVLRAKLYPRSLTIRRTSGASRGQDGGAGRGV